MKYFSKVAVVIIFVWLMIGCSDDESEVGNPVSWETDQVSLEAENFFVVAQEDTFYADVSNIDVHSDPGDSEYCSLELEWYEKGVEMRLFMYFLADGESWWANEMRTYDGEVEGEWIYYTGEFFKSDLGAAYTGSVEFDDDSTGGVKGKIHFDDLTLKAFK